MLFQVSLEGLAVFSREFWQQFPDKKVFLFHGSMGAGKTTLITALCRSKGVQDAVSSPTFSIINVYSYIENGEEQKIFHMDLYRLNSIEEVIQAGVEDSVYSGSICFVEWPEKAPELFDDQAVHVYIEAIDAQTRQIAIETADASFNSMKEHP